MLWEVCAKGQGSSEDGMIYSEDTNKKKCLESLKMNSLEKGEGLSRQREQHELKS